MDDSVLLIVDFDKICRLCLRSTGAMSDIFESCGETSLNELILCATGLEMQETDGLPPRICHKCRFIVEMSCELQSTATKAHKLLTEAAERNNSNNEDIIENYQDVTLIDLESLTFGTKASSVPIEETNETIIKKKTKKVEILQDKIICRDKESNGSLNNSLKCTNSFKRRTAPKNLTCQICLTSFQSEKLVQTHVDTHYEGTEFTSYLQLKRPYECSKCKDGVISKKQLIVHHREHLGVNPFVCKQDGCQFVGKDQDALRHHGLVHAGRSQVCERCGAAFRRAGELRAHWRRHRGTSTPRAINTTPPTLRCGWRGCPKLYRSCSSLRTHRRAHLAARDYVCPLCHVASYTSQSLLNRHMRMHGRSRVSKCDQCSLVFAEYGHFYRHRVLAHGQWLPHRCHGCHQGYRDKTKLEKHMEVCELAIKMKPYILAAEE